MHLGFKVAWILALSLVSAPLLAAPPEVGRARFPDAPPDVAPPPQPADDSVAREQQSEPASSAGDDLLPPPPPPPEGVQQTGAGEGATQAGAQNADGASTSDQAYAQRMPRQPASPPPRQSGYWIESPEPVHDMGTTTQEEPKRRRWYGWQILTADGGTLVVTAMLADTGRAGEDMIPLMVGGYLFGGPIVHAAHKNWGKAFGSLGLRTGLPIAGAFMGAGLEDCDGGDYCGFGGAIAGFMLGIAGAIAIDSAVLAYDAGPEKTKPRRRGSIDVSPMIGYGNAPTGVQVGGVF